MKLLLITFLLAIMLSGVRCLRQNDTRTSSAPLTISTPRQGPVVQLSDDVNEALQDLELIEDIP